MSGNVFVPMAVFRHTRGVNDSSADPVAPEEYPARNEQTYGDDARRDRESVILVRHQDDRRERRCHDLGSAEHNSDDGPTAFAPPFRLICLVRPGHQMISATHCLIRASIASRTRRKTSNRPSTLPVAADGSSNGHGSTPRRTKGHSRGQRASTS